MITREKIVERWKTRDHPPSEFDFNFFNDEDFGQLIIALDIDDKLSYNPKAKQHLMNRIKDW